MGKISLLRGVVAIMALSACADRDAKTAKAEVKNLAQIPFSDEFVPGREVLVDLVKIPPNKALDRHFHPGEEFQYYVEGRVRVERDGMQPIEGVPGTVGHIPYKTWHKATASSEGATILVFRVHTTGEPWRYVDEAAQKPSEGLKSPPPR